MNNKGKGAGLILIIILVVAAIVAVLFATQAGGLGFGKKDSTQEQIQQNAVDTAQDAVDSINQRMQDYTQTP